MVTEAAVMATQLGEEGMDIFFYIIVDGDVGADDCGWQ